MKSILTMVVLLSLVGCSFEKKAETPQAEEPVAAQPAPVAEEAAPAPEAAAADQPREVPPPPAAPQQ